MVLLQAHQLTFRYPMVEQPLFQSIDVSLYQGDKTALLGRNGTGKTTLLKLLAGYLTPEEGVVTHSGSVAFVQQEDVLEGGQSLREALLPDELCELYQRLTRMEQDGLPEPLAYADLIETFTARGGFVQLGRMEKDLELLGLQRSALDRPVTQLSGGERRLLKLVAAFISAPDVLLLDEPTNYLDERAVDYLITQLKQFTGACLIVSHDRWFLDQVVHTVTELERHALTAYSGNYTTFRQTKAAAFKESMRQKEKLEREITKLQATERSYKVWGARKEKEKSGAFDKGFIGARAAKLQKRAILAKTRMQERIASLEETKPWVDKHYQIRFNPVALLSGTCLVVRDVSFRYPNAPEAILQNISLTLEWGERLALSGENGSGKSTLIKLLTQALTPDFGEVLRSKGVRLGYLSQVCEVPDIREVSQYFSEDEMQEARTLLGAMKVAGDTFYQPFALLSEGQKQKVRLVQLLLSQPNVLILDEPTTHLDYDSVEMLEAALAEYTGTLILVSHDRYLRERLTERNVTV
jgi:ATP-binding cassette subfamily F protein 3